MVEMPGERFARKIWPIDTHIHLRQDEALENYVRHLGDNWAAILPMPNTKPAITTGEEATRYVEQIRLAGFNGAIIPTIKLTMATTPKMIREAVILGVRAAKFYPRGLTTNAEDGIGKEDFSKLDPVYRAMAECDMHLLIHGEMPGEENMTREIAFLSELTRIAEKFGDLRITLEHVTTAEALTRIDFLAMKRKRVSATITAHHLRTTLDTLLDGGLHMHDAYCKPVPKYRKDRAALIAAIVRPWYRFGSDSAPHLKGGKEKDCGCAGVYTAPIAIPLMLQTLEENSMPQMWLPFMYERAVKWFDLKLEGEPKFLKFERKPWIVPPEYNGVVSFMAGQELQWQISDE